MKQKIASSVLNRELLQNAVGYAFIKLSPVKLVKNPVICIVAVGAVLTTAECLLEIIHHICSSFNVQIALWLWFTVLFANFSEAVAEGREEPRPKILEKTGL